jgi:hypothetical protein
MTAGSQGYLFKGGSVITVDPALGVMPCADVRIRNGTIDAVGRDLQGDGLELIDGHGHDRYAGSRRYALPYVEHAWAELRCR